jgi:uncharacterized protein YaaQ
MENEVLIALIGVIGAIFGALITAILYYLSSKQKVKELEISYSQKTYEKLIEAARSHLEYLYLPLYKEISSLLYHYTKYRNICRIMEDSDQEGQQEVREALTKFSESISQFNKTVSYIFENGMTAYLIGAIEERLIDLRDLLEQSEKESTGIIERSVTTTVGISVFGTKVGKSMTKTTKMPIIAIPEFSGGEINIPGTLKVTVETKLLKAPLTSDIFDKQFMEYIIELKRDMREVTLWLKE